MSEDHYKPITMPEVRLCIGEGKLTAAQMLDACNAVMRTRKGHQLVTEMDQFAEILRERKALRESVRKLVGEWKHKSSDLVDRWEKESDDGDLRSARSIKDCATELEKLLAAHPEMTP